MEPASRAFSEDKWQNPRLPLLEEEVRRENNASIFSSQTQNVHSLRSSSVSTWKERGDFYLGRKELGPAIDAYTKALQQAEEKKDTKEMADCLKGIGSIFLEKKQWTLAAKVLNASLALYQRQRAQNEIAIKLVLALMVDVERRFLEKECGISNPNLSTRPQIYLERRDKLQELRQKIHAAMGRNVAVKQILEEFSHEVGAFLETMLHEMYPMIGMPPCEFTVLSLGSLARKEMSPYSDLEFAFLVENSSKEIVDYFKTAVCWLEIQVIHLGETPIKILDGGFVSPIDRGFSFDDGGNTPLGKQGQVELIQTPVQLAQFQTERLFSEDFILSNVLRTAGLLFGSAILYKEYLSAMGKVISMQSSRSSLTLRQERALNTLNGHLVEFKPRMNKAKQERPVFNVKTELYRLPNFLITGLAEYFCIEKLNSWDKLDALFSERPILSEEGVAHLKEALNEIMSLRMRCHMHYRQECDDVYHPSLKQNERQEVFILSALDLEKMTQIYRVILPLFRAFQEVCRSHNFADLVKFNFYDPVFEAQAKMHDDLGQYEDSEKYYLQALALQPDNADLQIEFAYTLIRKILHALDSKMRPQDQWQLDADEYKRKALEAAQRTNNKALLAKLRSLEGYCYINILNDPFSAFFKYLEALKITKSEYGDKHPAVAPVLGNLGTALIFVQNEQNMEQGKKFIKEALEIYQSSHIENTEVAFLLTHLGLGWLHFGQTKRALKYLPRALRIYKKELGDENPTVATILYWIAFAFQKLGQNKEAKNHYEQALRIGKRVFYENHTLLRLCIKGLGEINSAPYVGIYHHPRSVEAKIRKQQEELETLTKKFGEEHPAVADFLHQCGCECDELSQIARAIEYFSSALKIKIKLYQKDEHPSVSETLSKLGEMCHVQANTIVEFYAMEEKEEILNNAIKYYVYALQYKKRAKIDVYGDANPSVADTLEKLSLAWYLAKDLQASIESLEVAISIYRKVFGNDHRKTQDAVNALARIKEKQSSCCVLV